MINLNFIVTARSMQYIVENYTFSYYKSFNLLHYPWDCKLFMIQTYIYVSQRLLLMRLQPWKSHLFFFKEYITKLKFYSLWSFMLLHKDIDTPRIHVHADTITYTAHVPSFVDTWGWVMVTCHTRWKLIRNYTTFMFDTIFVNFQASDEPFILNAKEIDERINERING